MGDILWEIIALWFGASAGLWWVYRRRRASQFTRETELARQAKEQVEAAQGVFDAIRIVSYPVSLAESDGKQETHALLQRIQENGGFFDAVNVLHARLRRARADAECPALAETLHIRRDLWAASEIVLMEDASLLGEDFADAQAYERFRAEAAALLFKTGTETPRGSGPAGDLIDLRLSLAREEAGKFLGDIEEAARLAHEEDRLPSPREIAAYARGIVTAIPERARAARSHLLAFYRHVFMLARRIRESRGVTRGVAELRRVREELPGRVAVGAAQASALARQSAGQLKRHYEFLAAAHDFQARYAQFANTRADLSQQARQFIARLDLAARSERLRLTSASYAEWTKGQLAAGLAHLIAALPHWQARFDEARTETAKAAMMHPPLPFALRWPPEEENDKEE